MTHRPVTFGVLTTEVLKGFADERNALGLGTRSRQNRVPMKVADTNPVAPSDLTKT